MNFQCTDPFDRWYIARCEPGQDLRVAELLGKRGYTVKAPAMPVVRIWRHKRITAARAMFPGYLFVRVHRDGWDMLRSTPGVRYGNSALLKVGGRLAWLSDADPEFLAVCETETRLWATANEFEEPRLRPGDHVHVRKGPFIEFMATILTLDDDGRRAYLEDMLGRRVRANIEHLSKASPGALLAS